MSKKGALFYNGMARGDHRATMVFTSSLCTDTVPEAQAILDYFDDVRAQLAIDQALAAEGQGVFERDCACCHGTYADDPAAETFPNTFGDHLDADERRTVLEYLKTL